ncbi:MAG: (Fe-S)-binding protein [Acidobacteriota bacterium]
MKVSLFVTCLVDQLFPQVGLSTVRVLERLGVEVDFDPGQTCCGQPAFNSGFTDEAAKVARHFLEVYRDADNIVVPSGSCCAMIKVFLPRLFEEGSPEQSAAREIAERTYELSDFLVSVLGVTRTGSAFHESVTYHDSCHALRELGVREQPRTLIRGVDGIDFREMQNSERCCGFGGTFSVKFADVSSAIGLDKIKSILDSGASYVVATDVSCLMHIGGLLKRKQIPVQTLHLAELLSKSHD